MKKYRSTWKYANLAYGLVGAVWLGYVVLLFLAKTDNQYHLGFGAVNLIRVTFALPILLIWLSATLAAVRFKAYAELIHGSPEAVGFNRIARGLFFLLGYLVLLLMLGRVVPLFAGTSLIYPAVFIKNHLPVVLLVLAFVELFRGAVHLADLAKAVPSRRECLTAGLAYLVFTALFVAHFFSKGADHKSLADNIPAFAVPHAALLFTLVIPSLVAWGMGILAAMYLRAYIHQVKGRIYQDVLRLLLRGVYASVSFAILTELLVFDADSFRQWGLNAVLLLVYCFLIAYAFGAVLMARSAAKLTRIEGVS